MADEKTPYIDNEGDIIIPFHSDAKYQYWNKGQSLADTLQELNVNEAVWKKHVLKKYPGNGA